MAAKKAKKKVAAKAVKAKTGKLKKTKTVSKAAKKSAAKVTNKKRALPKKKVASKKTATIKKVTKKTAPKISKQKSSPKKGIVKANTATKTSVKPAASLQNFITPLDDRVLVRLSGAEKKTAGGLFIPDTVSDVSGNLEGQVVSVGRGHMSKKGHTRPMDVKVGDRVVFADFSGSKIKIQNEDLIILRESELMGVVAK